MPGLFATNGPSKRLALDERKHRDVPAVEVQEIKRVVDQVHAAFAVRRRLRLRKTWQSSVINAAEFAVDVGGLHVEVRKRGDCARVLGCPVQSGPGQKLHAAIVDARGHTIAVELDLMQPLRT